jgi:hypothetical protein
VTFYELQKHLGASFSLKVKTMVIGTCTYLFLEHERISMSIEGMDEDMALHWFFVFFLERERERERPQGPWW